MIGRNNICFETAIYLYTCTVNNRTQSDTQLKPVQNVLEMLIIHNENDNDNDNDNECFILTYELIKQIIYSTGTMIDQYSHSQGNYIMTYISLACNYLKMYLKIIVVINSLCFKYC